MKGCNFLLKNIPDEAFIYQRQSNPEYKFPETDAETVFPYLLVNIGSGVSIVKVRSALVTLLLKFVEIYLFGTNACLKCE